MGRHAAWRPGRLGLFTALLAWLHGRPTPSHCHCSPTCSICVGAVVDGSVYGTVQGNPYGSSADKAFQVNSELGMRHGQRKQCTMCVSCMSVYVFVMSVPCDEYHTRPSLSLIPLRAGHERAGHRRLCVSSCCVHVLLPCAALFTVPNKGGAHHAVDQHLPQTPVPLPSLPVCVATASHMCSWK